MRIHGALVSTVSNSPGALDPVLVGIDRATDITNFDKATDMPELAIRRD